MPLNDWKLYLVENTNKVKINLVMKNKDSVAGDLDVI